MTRKKVKLLYIANDSARKATFKKRKRGLIKKVKELSTLCGVNACAIVYSPYDISPEVWPSLDGVHRVLSEFQMMPEMDQSKKMVNQEVFIRQRVSKASDHLKRQRKDNREKEMTEVMFQCLIGNMGMFHLNLMDLNDLGFLVDQYCKNINRRIEIMRKSESIGESSSTETFPALDMPFSVPIPYPTGDLGSSSFTGLNPFEYHQQHEYQQQHQQIQLQQLQQHPNNQFQYQHHPHHQLNPSVGIYDPNLAYVDQTMQGHQHQWYIDLMNDPEQMAEFVSEEIGFPFMDGGNHNNNHNHNHNAPIAPTASASITTAATSTINPSSATGNNLPGGCFG